MKNRPILMATLTLAGLALPACRTDTHVMVEPAPGTTIVCRECYAQITKVRRTYGFGPDRAIRPGREWLVARHQCPGCKSEMSIYREDGVVTIKCARCAPDGLACDKCLPPDGEKN